jgi:hypothetical protein
MPLPISQLWTETITFVRRESALLTPLMLSTLALGQAGLVMAFGEIAKGETGGIISLAMVFCWVLITLGQLAITALVLTPGMSVAEGLKRGASALPKMALIFLWTAMVLILVAAPLTFMLQKTGVDPSAAALSLKPIDLLILSPILLVAIWFSVRTLVLQAVLIDGKPTALASLLQSFRMTRGNGGSLLRVIIMFFVVGQIFQMIAAVTAGLILGGIFTQMGAPVIGAALSALVAGAAGAVPATFQSVFAALLYRKLAA